MFALRLSSPDRIERRRRSSEIGSDRISAILSNRSARWSTSAFVRFCAIAVTRYFLMSESIYLIGQNPLDRIIRVKAPPANLERGAPGGGDTEV